MVKLWSYSLIVLGGMAAGMHLAVIIIEGTSSNTIAWLGVIIMSILYGIWSRERV